MGCHAAPMQSGRDRSPKSGAFRLAIVPLTTFDGPILRLARVANVSTFLFLFFLIGFKGISELGLTVHVHLAAFAKKSDISRR